MEAPTDPWLERSDVLPALGLFLLSLSVNGLTAALAALWADVPLGAYGVYFDGHEYLEIARSFPLPYAPEGHDYLSKAPGYPALIALLRAVLPDAAFDWGTLALLASWLPAALSSVAFYALCRQVGLEPLAPSAVFALANPAWLSIASSARPSSLAMLFVLLCFGAALRDRLGQAVLWLSLAGLTRFPALLLGLPLAWHALWRRGPASPARVALLAVPLLAFGAVNLYMAWRVPGFRGVWNAHGLLWQTGLSWPFAAWIDHARAFSFGTPGAAYEVTYGSLLLFGLGVAVGLRPSQRQLWLLPLWISVLALFHVCLSAPWSPHAFTRLSILAWPAALLILWRWAGPRGTGAAFAAACAGLGLLAAWHGAAQNAATVTWQKHNQKFLELATRRLQSEQPYWLDFTALLRSELIRSRVSGPAVPPGAAPTPGARPPRATPPPPGPPPGGSR